MITVFHIQEEAEKAGAKNIAVSRLGNQCFRVDCTGLDGEERESLRLLLTERFDGARFCVEERSDI